MKFSLESRTTRALLAAAIIAVSVAGLSAAGILFTPAEETVERTGDSGETVTIDIRAADTSIPTPGSDVLAVGLEEGDLAPDFEFSTITGERARLSDYRGQAVYLNFWASWCTPCRAEMPDILAQLDIHGEENLAVIAINAGESFDPAIGFVEELEMEDLTAVGMDPTRQVLEAYKVRSMPTSVFIDREGRISHVHPGFATADQMKTFIEEALAAPVALK